jgi:Ras-related protein Rab-7A
MKIDDKEFVFQIWDTAGQEKYQSLCYAYYRGCDCCALVYDITNPESFENVAKWKEIFLEHAMVTE